MKDKYRLGKELSFIHFVMVEHSFLFLLDVVHGKFILLLDFIILWFEL